LVLLGVAAFGGLPLAYGVASPAVYIPLTLMLFALIWRGVSIEVLAQYPTWRPGWGAAFGLGSLVAALCQGAAFGGLVAGIQTNGATFAGGPLSFLHGGYAVLTGLTATAPYMLAGAAWMFPQVDGGLQQGHSRSG